MQETRVTGRKLRDHSNHSINYMLVTLGIEKDDDSDDDFVVDDREDQEEEEDRFLSESDTETTQKPASQQRKQQKQKRKVESLSKPTRTIDTQGNQKRTTDKQRTHTPLMLPKIRLLIDYNSHNFTVKRGRAIPKATLETLYEPSNGEDSGCDESVGGYYPRMRASAHLDELQPLVGERSKIKNTVSPFSPGPLESWSVFERDFKKYKEKYNLKFRVRSSERTDLYNKTHDDKMPTTFEWTYKTFRCTHGVSQESRSKGHRNRKSRYCGCQARLTAAVTRVVGNTYAIAIRNENHTHTHPNSKTEASSYLTTKTLPLDVQDLEDVKTLADSRVSSAHITNFLNDRIGPNGGHVRHRHADEGSEINVRAMGETLAMDFTHGTNNLGYHLGSLVVTTATGRGFPVVDFISLNEQAVTISTILEYFKEKNPCWQHVQTAAIDKDFVEWRVLTECVPDATILLCQFHAISYWKKAVQRPVYRLKIGQREDLLNLMTKLLYSPTQEAYDGAYGDLKDYCTTNKKQTFFTYFDKNWHSCRGMWSNFARGQHFTAGNTTTNRIESNWNQLKMLLGLKTRIDKTVAGLLQHQMTITQQIVSEIVQLHLTLRVSKTVPRFLRAVANRLAANILNKVKKEWERFVNLMPTATYERGSDVSIWEVHHSNQTFTCHDVDWTCTCLFYKSNHLPCRHLMQVASKGHRFEMLPASSIQKRWSTFDVLGVKDDLASAADALGSIVRMSTLRSPKETLSADKFKDSTVPSSKQPKQVAYVRLRRHERANQVVLSSAEKYSYAKAMLEPLLEHLSNLSSASFYQELRAWKDTVEIGLRGGNSDSENAEDVCAHDVLDVDMYSALDPADAMGTANLMDALETTSPEYSSDSSNDDDALPATQIGEIQQEHPAPAATPVRQVDVVSVPKPKRRGRPRTTTKQLPQTKLTSGLQRLAVHQYPSGFTVSLHQLVMWARCTPNLKYVLETMEKYPVQLEDAYLRSRTIDCQWEAMLPSKYMHNFVIPVDLTRSMQAAITTTKTEQRQPDALDGSVKKQGIVLDVVASIDPKLWKFSGQYVYASAVFYDIKAKGRAWLQDRKWLEQDWRKVRSDVDLFARQTNTCGLSANAACDRHQVLANEVISKFATTRLRTEFGTLSGKGLIGFENIVGGVCRGWLNDSPIDFCLETIAASVEGAFGLSSLSWTVGWPKTPPTSNREVKFIVNPVNLKANHWGIIIISLKTTKKMTRLHVYMYEPLIDEGYRSAMETVWVGIPKKQNDESSEEREGLRGFVLRWHEASIVERKLILDPIEWVETPQQPDGASGVLVVAQAHNYLTENVEQQNYGVSSHDIKVMRLRMLWVIMNLSKENTVTSSDALKTKEIQQKLEDELK